MNDDGTMARVPDLVEFCKLHGLKMVTVAEVIRYRLQHERYIKRVGEALLPTEYGEFRMISYESEVEGGESHVALVYGDVDAAHDAEPVLVRVHTHCLAGNVFGATSCECRAAVEGSMRAIAEAGRGALVYLHHTQRGFGVDRSVEPGRLAFHREGRSVDRPGDREYLILRQVGLGGQILSDLGIRKIKLLSNHRRHIPALQGFGIEIVEQVPITAFRDSVVER
jgi:3,4-dihydroxy 2-butanone 4-phosphate synthase/GTP cyclohydrolase II